MRPSLDKKMLIRLLKSLGESFEGGGKIYLTGGATALLHDWREMTVDLDIKADPEPKGFFEGIAKVKITENANIELASPDQFVPQLNGWKNRSIYIDTFNETDFYHYDPYGQVLAKLERFHPRDKSDIENFVGSGIVSPERLLKLFQEVGDQCIRYPSIDAVRLESRLIELKNA
jgi:hypothetical protein